MCSRVQLEPCRCYILPGLSRPWWELHWHSTPPSTWHWWHTVAASWCFHPYWPTSLLLAVVPAHSTKHPNFSLSLRSSQISTVGNIILVTERKYTSDRTKCPTLAQGFSPWFRKWKVSSNSSSNISRAGFMSSALSFWPAHHPQNTITEITFFFFCTK